MKSSPVGILALLFLHFYWDATLAHAFSDRSKSSSAESEYEMQQNPSPATSSISNTSAAAPAAAGPATSEQAKAQAQALRTNRIGFGISAAGGVVSCAEGANLLSTEKTKSGVLLDSCVTSLQTANKMKALSEQGGQELGGFELDGDMLDSERAQAIFRDLAARYGVTRDQLAAYLLKNRGNPKLLLDPASLDSLTGGKLSAAELGDAVSSAEKLSKEERDRLLAESRVAGLSEEYLYKLAASKSQRDSTRQRLVRAPAGSGVNVSGSVPAASASARESDEDIRFVGDPLTPLSDPLFAREERAAHPPEPALTIFDVVSRKYREKTPHLILTKP